MCLKPCSSAIYLGDKWHTKLGYALHSLLNNALNGIKFAVERIDNHLVVYLHNHLRGDALGLESTSNLNHR